MLQTVLVSVAYVAAQIMADITSLKIVTLWGLSMDAGTFIYPITFTLRDMVHKVAGIKVARALIIAAGVINIFMAVLFWFVSWLPGDPLSGDFTSFAEVLSPVWRIVVASILAEVIAQLLDTETYQFWVTRITQKYQWARVLISNAVSVPLDSLVFVWVAFGGVLPTPVVWSIFWANVLLKGITTVISIPGIYMVKQRG